MKPKLKDWRIMPDKPDWERLDSLRSIKEVAIIGAGALKELLIDAADWVDTRLADRVNGDQDD